MSRRPGAASGGIPGPLRPRRSWRAAAAGAGAAMALMGSSTWAQFSLESANYWARENEGTLRIAVIRSGPLTAGASVSFATTNATAKAGQDFAATSGTLAFAEGVRVQWVEVPLLNNGQKDGARSFTVGLGQPSGEMRLGTPRITSISLIDNDPGIQFEPVQHWVFQDEAQATLTVSRGNDVQLEAFTVDYTTLDGSALAGRDYRTVAGTLAFPTGTLTQTITVPLLTTAFAAPDRQFRVRLERPVGGLPLGPSTNISAIVTLGDRREMVPHRLELPRFLADGQVSLGLAGGFTQGLGVSNRFDRHFDIIPLEVSSDLMRWSSLGWVIRTNSAANSPSWIDANSPGVEPRFYRTPAATYVAPQRPPSGPYAVGFQDRVLVDPERWNRFRIATNNTFPITVWYPARRVAGQWPSEPYHPREFARDNRPGAWEGSVDRAPHWKRYALRDAPFADLGGPAPVVLWSSGYLFSRFDVQEWAEHLASHGYVVVAPDHRDSSAISYPDGRYLYFHYADTVGRTVDLKLLQDRVRDLNSMLNALTQWNQDDPLLTGRVDVEKVGAMGWSLGGSTALEFARADSRVRAVIGLDASSLNLSTLLASPLRKPVLFIQAEDNADRQLFDANATSAMQFQVRGTVHDSFSAYYWDVNPASADRGREAARTLVDYSVWFLDRQLKGIDRPMPAISEYSKLFRLLQK